MMNWDFLFEKNIESFAAAEGELLPELNSIVAELVRLNLSNTTKVAQLGEKSDGVFVVNKHPRESFRVTTERLPQVIAELQALPDSEGATWDDIRPIVDPPEPLQGLDKFQEQLDALGFGLLLSFSSSEEGEGRVVYRAVSFGCAVARCICTKDQWGYWSYRVEILRKRSYSGFSINENDYDDEVAFDGIL